MSNIFLGQDAKTRFYVLNRSPVDVPFSNSFFAKLNNITTGDITYVSHKILAFPSQGGGPKLVFDSVTGELSSPDEDLRVGMLFGVELIYQPVALGALTLAWEVNPSITPTDCNVANNLSTQVLTVV